MRVCREIITDFAAVINHDMRIEHRMGADPGALAHNHVSPNRGVWADRGTRCDYGRRMNAHLGLRSLIEEAQCSRKIEIRVFRDKRRSTNVVELLGCNNSGCSRVLNLGRIFRVCEKGYLSGTG